MNVILAFVICCAFAGSISHPSSAAPGSGITATNTKKPYALIAGGSKGIGFAIAQALAKRGFNLVLVARHLEGLEHARDSLQSTYGITVEILVYDLTWETAAADIGAWCTERDIPLKMLCNVAGLGGDDDYLSLDVDSLRYMVDLNIESTMALTLTLLPLLEKNAPSWVMNVASMAGFAPIPEKNLYSATKSAVIFFSYSLHYQLKEKDISVSCLAPGPVFTKPRIRKETRRQLGWLGMRMAVPPHRVGEIAVRKTLDGKLLIVPGTLPTVTAAIIRVLPRKMITSIYFGLGKK